MSFQSASVCCDVGKPKTWDSYCFFYYFMQIFTLSVVCFISLFCVDHDKTGLKYCIQKPAEQSVQEGRINSNFSVLLQNVPHWAFHGLPQGWACGKGVTNLIQMSHPDVVWPWGNLLYSTGVDMCVAMLLLTVCYLLTFHLPIQLCCFCFTCPVRCILDCCWTWWSCGKQASHQHSFVPGGQAIKRSCMDTCTPLKIPEKENHSVMRDHHLDVG